MRIFKRINNNAVLAMEQGKEVIVMGKGIGFSARLDSEYAPNAEDKIFVLNSREKTRHFAQLVSEIPLDFIAFTEEIINYIQTSLGEPLDSNIYITLTDHIYFAIKRQKENKQVAAIMLPEMKLLYPKEYKVAQRVVEKINTHYGTQLGDNEIGFILMHILNALSGEENSLNSLKILEISKFILDTVGKASDRSYDTESIKYNRFLVHVKFLAKRIVYREMISQKDLNFLDAKFRKGKEYKVAKRVAEALKKQYGVNLHQNEVDYLAMHFLTIDSREGDA